MSPRVRHGGFARFHRRIAQLDSPAVLEHCDGRVMPSGIVSGMCQTSSSSSIDPSSASESLESTDLFSLVKAFRSAAALLSGANPRNPARPRMLSSDREIAACGAQTSATIDSHVTGMA